MSELLTYSQVSFHPHPWFQPGITDSSSEPQWSYTSDLPSEAVSHRSRIRGRIAYRIQSTPHVFPSHATYRHICDIRSMCPFRYTVSRLFPAPSPSLLCCPPACCNSSSVISSCLVYRHRHDICGIGLTECHQ